MKHQSGITLIETMVVITLSSMIVIIAYSILYSATKANQSSIENIDFRNEAVLIFTQFDKIMMNVDIIEINGETDDKGSFKSLNAIDTGFRLDESSGTYKNITRSNTIIEIKEKDLLINGKRVNSEHSFVDESSFNLKNGGLLLNLIISNSSNDEKYEVSKLYHLQSE